MMGAYMHVGHGRHALGQALIAASNALARDLSAPQMAKASEIARQEIVDAIFDPVIDRFVGLIDPEEANDN